MTPTPVTIVRPRRSPRDAVAYYVGVILGYLLTGALLTYLAMPFIWPEYPLGYWQTVVAMWAIRVFTGIGTDTAYMRWTREP